MGQIITLDNIIYDLRIEPGELKRSLDILDGSAAGRAKTSGAMILDTKGMFPNYSLKFRRSGDNVTEYDAFVEALSDPKKREHILKIAYGQGTITYEAYAAGIADALYSQLGGVNYWDNLTAKFIAMKAYKTP